MELSNLKERLTQLDSVKLIDIVKNYRQYGYTEEIRAYALKLLEGQGISTEDLRLTGNLENTSYNFADNLYQSYNTNSRIAFVGYCVSLLLKAISIYLYISSSFVNTVILICLILSSLIFIIFLAKSFFNHLEFYRATGSELGSEVAWLYLLLGMPFYIIMFFYLRKQMRERMNLIT